MCKETATVPLYLRTGDERTRSLFPQDPHLTHSAAVAAWIRGHTPPTDRVLVMWGAADLQFQADRPPATPYLWFRNVQTIPGAIARVQAQLADPTGVRWVVLVHRPRKMDPGGTTGRLLFENFRRAATVDGIPIFERR
jgi:hypothetical protein